MYQKFLKKHKWPTNSLKVFLFFLFPMMNCSLIPVWYYIYTLRKSNFQKIYGDKTMDNEERAVLTTYDRHVDWVYVFGNQYEV